MQRLFWVNILLSLVVYKKFLDSVLVKLCLNRKEFR